MQALPLSIVLLIGALLIAPGAIALATASPMDPGPSADIQAHAGACLERAGHETACTVQYIHYADVWDSPDLLSLVPPPECARNVTASSALSVPGSEDHAEKHERTAVPHIGASLYDSSCTFGHSGGPTPLAQDVPLSGDVPVLGHVFVASDMLPASDTVDTGALVCLTVRMVLESGAEPGEGPVVAQGTATKSVVTGPRVGADLPILEEPCPGSTGFIGMDEVSEFVVDLGKPQQDLKSGSNTRLRIQLYQWSGADPDEPDNVAQEDWKLLSGAEHPARIVLPVEDALEVKIQDVLLFDETVFVHARAHSPWGSMDAEVSDARFEVIDEQGDLIELRYLRPPITNLGHDPTAPRSITFGWDHAEEDLEPGRYLLRVSATNSQGTATASNETWVHLQENEPPKESPLPVLLPFAAAVWWLARAHRDRPRRLERETPQAKLK